MNNVSIYKLSKTHYTGENYCLTRKEAEPIYGVRPTWIDLYGLFLKRSYNV